MTDEEYQRLNTDLRDLATKYSGLDFVFIGSDDQSTLILGNMCERCGYDILASHIIMNKIKHHGSSHEGSSDIVDMVMDLIGDDDAKKEEIKH